ncbi:acyltransferase family protein [Herminiimonas aquatilis]|uniref:Acyltransferase family protein n=1 Tax=Herminiimonas aquatilis TaxID=345342 RepID=A0ABW2JAN0_9BURK
MGLAFEQSRRDSDNNFLILRLVAASLVVYGHSFALAAPCASCIDMFGTLFRYRYSGDIGLHIFFIISGFLVTASFCNRSSLIEFMKARLLRIYPALMVCSVLMILLGAVLTTYDQSSYWSSSETWRFWYLNFTLRGIAFDLPGVFQELKFKAMNGSLWSLAVELRLYFIVAIFGLLGAFRSRRITNIVLIAIVFLAVLKPQWIFFFSKAPENLRVAGFFLLGSLAYMNRSLIPMRWALLVVSVAIAAITFGTVLFEWFAGVTLCYGVFLIAFARKIQLPAILKDYSYGIYLYAWPIQQLIALNAPEWGPYAMFSLALPIAWALGAASWFLIEKTAMRLKRVNVFTWMRSTARNLVPRPSA